MFNGKIMKLCIISDTHAMHAQVKIPKCDVLIHCGDFCNRGSVLDLENFLNWFVVQPADHLIFIAGNHDRCLDYKDYRRDEALASIDAYQQLDKSLCYLENNGITIDTINFWGSPNQPEFNAWAFNFPRDGKELKDTWDSVPSNTDVLITHTPPQGILDKCKMSSIRYPANAGCQLLLNRIKEVEPIINAVGHIHEHGGRSFTTSGLKTKFINASICNFNYKPVNKPIVITI